MPKPALEPKHLPSAIQREQLRHWYYQQHGYDTTEISRLIDHYFWRIQQPESEDAQGDGQ